MAVPHVLLSTEQYNRLKNKIQEYESKFSNQNTEIISNSIEEGENDKEMKIKEGNIKYESKKSDEQKDENKIKHESSTTHGKRNMSQNKKPKIKRNKKKAKIKDKIIMKDEIIKMMTPPGEREEIYSKPKVKSIDTSSFNKKKWISI
jgi:ribonuclease BN (tRNA processing enzyme)